MSTRFSKRKRLQQQENALKQANRYQCAKKVFYRHAEDAWEAAEYFYVLYGEISTAYKCACGEHYHLTKHTSLGDMSHLPPEVRELFATVNQEVEESGWTKLRRWLGLTKDPIRA